jgi:hypothetical protein
MNDEHQLPPVELQRRLRMLSLAAGVAGALSVPAVLDDAGSTGVNVLIAAGCLACGAAAWILARREQTLALAAQVLLIGLALIFGVAALIATEPAVWVGAVAVFGLLSAVAVWLWGREIVRLWLLGGIAIWAVPVIFGQGDLTLPPVSLALVCLLGANGIAWRLVGAPAPASIDQAQTPLAQAPVETQAVEGAAAGGALNQPMLRELERAVMTIHNVMAEQISDADRQAGVLTNVIEAVEHYQQSTSDLKQMVQSMVDSSESIVQFSDSGKEVAASAIMSLEHIRTQVKAIAINLDTLVRHTESIGEIISSLGDLATQSNFLALNASIEAARAGQHGQGFAVVADEIRDLAQQSAESAAQVRSTLADIRQAVQQTAAATDTGADSIETGVSKVTDTAQAVGRISHGVIGATTKTEQVMTTVERHAVELDEIAASIKTINQVQMQYVANTRLAEATAGSLIELLKQLKSNGGQTIGGAVEPAEEVKA